MARKDDSAPVEVVGLCYPLEIDWTWPDGRVEAYDLELHRIFERDGALVIAGRSKRARRVRPFEVARIVAIRDPVTGHEYRDAEAFCRRLATGEASLLADPEIVRRLLKAG